MNKEIKEIKHILELLHFECNPKAREEDINKVLDYITNLQEENRILKEQKEHLLIDLDGESEYKVMCEKAIEYINEKADYPIGYYHCLKELRNLLQGEDNEN